MHKMYVFQLIAITLLWQGMHGAIVKRADDRDPLQAVVEQLTSQVQSLTASLTALQTTVGRLDQNVAFRAGIRSEYLTGLTAHVVINFPNIYLNEGNGYDHVSGHFQAPLAGTYVFFLRIQNRLGEDVNTAIYHEGHPIAYAYTDDEDWETASTLATVNLSRGDRVWVQVLSNSADSIRGSDRSLFTGFLLRARE